MLMCIWTYHKNVYYGIVNNWPQTGNNPKCPPTVEWIHFDTIEYYTITTNKNSTKGTSWSYIRQHK